MSRVVLLTGATGFVGRQVLRQLLLAGCEVRLVVREGKPLPNIPIGNVVTTVATPDLFFETVEWWEAVCSGVHTVVHAAWYAQPGDYLHSAKNLACLSGTIALAQGAAQAGVKRFVGVGTCFEYDFSDPTRDLDVHSPLRPITPYAGAKVAAFNTLLTWFVSRHVSFAWCRLFYLYGEGEDPRRLAPYVRAQLTSGQVAMLTHGKQVRDFLDVQEAGAKLAKAALGEHSGPINICSGKAMTVRELVEQIAHEFGREDLLAFGARPQSPEDPPRVVGIPTCF